MTRAQRRLHLLTWLVLTPLALVLLCAALSVRPVQTQFAGRPASRSPRGAE